MIPSKPRLLPQSEMFRISLACACWPDHPLVQLAEQIPCQLYCPDDGHLGFPTRMMFGLLLKHARGWPDEDVGEWWPDSPYARYNCGETHFQQESQLDLNNLSEFRIRIGEAEYGLILTC